MATPPRTVPGRPGQPRRPADLSQGTADQRRFLTWTAYLPSRYYEYGVGMNALKLVAMLCVVLHGVMPSTPRVCAQKPTPTTPQTALPGSWRWPAPQRCGCQTVYKRCCRTKCSAAPNTRSDSTSDRCRQCCKRGRCNLPKDPIIPHKTANDTRTVLTKDVAAAGTFAVCVTTSDDKPWGSSHGPGPPSALISHNQRQAQLATWLN